jgi:uncharacterized protein
MLRWKIARILPISILLGMVLAGCGSPAKDWPYSVEISGVRLDVEVAATPAERARGRMDRDELGRDWGMLFVFQQEETQKFWMRNTRMPLSIAFVGADLVVRDVQDMEPMTDDVRVSAAPALYAIEANKGWFRRHGIAPGSAVKFSRGLDDYLRAFRAATAQ